MPCFSCCGQDDSDDNTHKSSRGSVYLSESRLTNRRGDSSRTHLRVMEELSESTYGLAVEGNEHKHYEAQDFFAFKEILGSGVMAVVFRAFFKPTGKAYAVKFIANFKQSRHYVSRELAILQISQHCRYIVQYHSHFRVRENMYFVLELCEGGTLENLMGNKALMPPGIARVYLKELGIALMYLHNAKYVHRDVHMANCLITSSAHIRLTDFGLSRTVDDPDGEMMTICGRAAIRAPEMYLDKLCGFGLDWWSFGIILYRFLTGYYPFPTEKLTQGFQSVTKFKEKYPEWLFNDRVSTDLCQRLLDKDPKQRIGYNNEAEIKNHPYFAKVNWDVEDNIEFVLEQDVKNISKGYFSVYKKLFQILGIHYHPLIPSDDSKTSDLSISERWNRELNSRSIARQITDFLTMAGQEQARPIILLETRKMSDTAV